MWWEGKKREKLREHIEKAWRGGETENREGQQQSQQKAPYSSCPRPPAVPQAYSTAMES